MTVAVRPEEFYTTRPGVTQRRARSRQRRVETHPALTRPGSPGKGAVDPPSSLPAHAAPRGAAQTPPWGPWRGAPADGKGLQQPGRQPPRPGQAHRGRGPVAESPGDQP